MNKKFFIKNSLKALQLFCCLSLLFVASSCQKDEKFIGEIELPKEVNLMELNQWSYTIPFEIKSDTDWEISFEFDDAKYICYAYPNKGNGNATINLCILDNWSDERRSGEMYIKFPKDSSKDQVIKLSQQCNLDNPDNDDPSDVKAGNRIYAVGYGYNFMGEIGSSNSVSLNPIVKIATCINNVQTGGVDASFQAKVYTGSCVSELMNELNAEAKFGGKYKKFKGEIGATFGRKDFKNSNNEYAITEVEVAQQNIYLELNRNDIICDYMTDAAYEAINGLPHKGKRGYISTSYPTTTEGLQKLIQDYGTHLILKARLGGKLKYSMVVDASKVEGSYDLKAFANCSYKTKKINLQASISDNLKSSYSKNTSACDVKLMVKGGDKKSVSDLGQAFLTNKDIDAPIEEWLKTIGKTSNQTLVGLDVNDGVVPLYDLLDMRIKDNQERYNKLKSIIEGTTEEDAQIMEQATTNSLKIDMNYQSGTIGHIADIPTFDQSNGKSLVKDVFIGGQHIAQICKEYIPLINKKERVTVVYPVLNNIPKYNMGFFIGDEAHRPAKICTLEEGDNDKTIKVEIIECTDEPIGAKKELYLRGSNCNLKKDESSNTETIAESKIEDSYLTASYYEKNEYNYPLVKIFTNIWLRENYGSTLTSNGVPIDNISTWTDRVFYGYKDVINNSNFAPEGWKVPSAQDYNAIKELLANNGISTIGGAFLNEGLLGYDAQLYGYIDPSLMKRYIGNNTVSIFFTSDANIVRINKNGTFNIEKNIDLTEYNTTLRLIKIK